MIYHNMRSSLVLKTDEKYDAIFFHFRKCNFLFIKIQNRLIDLARNSKVNLKDQ